jgi:hypothetical protein
VKLEQQTGVKSKTINDRKTSKNDPKVQMLVAQSEVFDAYQGYRYPPPYGDYAQGD